MTNFMSSKETYKKIENEGVLQIEWSIDDIQGQCPLLNDKECKEVLKEMYDKDDAYYGINWEVIDDVISKLYPEKWKKYIEERGSNLTGRCRSV